MATYTKFEVFSEHLLGGVHDLFGTHSTSAHTTALYLSNTTPVWSSHQTKGDLAEITAGGGYSAGGQATLNIGTRSGLTSTLTGTTIVWTGSGSGTSTFRHVIHYNDTPTAPADPLINSWDIGSAISLRAGDTFSVYFSSQTTTGTIFTLA